MTRQLDHEKDGLLIGRLVNWKFSSALLYLREDHPEQVTFLVNALANSFGNCGWFDGAMGYVVSGAVRSMVPEDEEEEPQA